MRLKHGTVADAVGDDSNVVVVKAFYHQMLWLGETMQDSWCDVLPSEPAGHRCLQCMKLFSMNDPLRSLWDQCSRPWSSPLIWKDQLPYWAALHLLVPGVLGIRVWKKCSDGISVKREKNWLDIQSQRRAKMCVKVMHYMQRNPSSHRLWLWCVCVVWVRNINQRLQDVVVRKVISAPWKLLRDDG